jgi:hypothetical protein
MKLKLLSNSLAIARFEPKSPLPDWATLGDFISITRTIEEISVVCDESLVPSGAKLEKGWRAFKVEGPLDFGLTGVLASIANTLAEAGVSIFAVSTFDTDYILVRESMIEAATFALSEAGHTIR